jgi:hypothetical protein
MTSKLRYCTTTCGAAMALGATMPRIQAGRAALVHFANLAACFDL